MLKLLNLLLQDEIKDSTENSNISDSIRLTTIMEFKTEYLNCVPTFFENPSDLNEFIKTQ